MVMKVHTPKSKTKLERPIGSPQFTNAFTLHLRPICVGREYKGDARRMLSVLQQTSNNKQAANKQRKASDHLLS